MAADSAPHYWQLPGPPKARLEREEVCALLGVSERQLRRLITEGHFPPPTQLGARTKGAWPALDVAAFLYLRDRGCRPGADMGHLGDETEKD